MRSKGGGLVIESRRVETPYCDGEPGELPAGSDKCPARRELWFTGFVCRRVKSTRASIETLRIRSLKLHLCPRT